MHAVSKHFFYATQRFLVMRLFICLCRRNPSAFLQPVLVVLDLVVTYCAHIDLVVNDLVVWSIFILHLTLEMTHPMRAETVHAWWLKPPGLMHMIFL